MYDTKAFGGMSGALQIHITEFCNIVCICRHTILHNHMKYNVRHLATAIKVFTDNRNSTADDANSKSSNRTGQVLRMQIDFL